MQIIVGLLVLILACVLALVSRRPTGAAWSTFCSLRFAQSRWKKRVAVGVSKSVAAVSIIASGYAYIYSLANEAYQRGETNASLRLTSFVTLVGGQRPAFVAAVNDFATVQNAPSYEAPSFWRVGSWYQSHRLNRLLLSNWAISFFAQCEPATCGHDKFRVDLRESRLTAADLMLVNLDDADLGYASAAEVQFVAASLRNSRLRSARLSNASIGGADFTGAKMRTCAELGPMFSRKMRTQLNLSMRTFAA
ncbi:Pentapeptide repeat-containing protein [Bradyrhizobium sp. Ghvi]|uniref:pentapeptide repeat-containing protein n=1 Tax=Bradyrhizobium sp. Ghvi TaxID=1855319 RepID=UPI0008F2F63C|nr:pentapeptide repeat-containing protein [Bradyrhizobium sp. Ghvi]SFP87562.1 Pentapeptide repeat-containing protein [Bradyrhizobium sp. Ghvi]